MKLLTFTLSAFVLFASSGALAVTVVPLNGQTSQTIQQDTSACQSQANAQFPMQNTVPSGGRIKGAATAAVAGATAAEVRGRQHDNVYDQIDDDDIKQDYRQNRAHSAAAAGAVVGASRQRQERRQNLGTTEQSITANNSVYSSCLQQRGYNVLP